MSQFNHVAARAIREERGLTREQVAVRIRKSFGVVAKIERGECRPSIVTLGALANAYGCSVADFFDGDDEPDLLGEYDPRPTELGANVDEWVRTTLSAMPPMTPDVARRVSALLFPATASKHRAAS